MAQVHEASPETRSGYTLEGTLLEACSCGVLCPCWIGEDPDLGECHAIVGYHIDKGVARGVDVSGLSAVIIAHIPGNVLAGNWEIVLLMDDRASEEQHAALLAALTGELGGPMADLAQLIGTVKGIETVRIDHGIVDGAGTLSIPGIVDAEMEPYRGPDGSVTILQGSVFSTVPGSPAWVAKAGRNRVELPQYGMTWEYEGRNAIQAEWKMEHAG